jgi:DNA invertase Pin-like site-specific DNA recombinase
MMLERQREGTAGARAEGNTEINSTSTSRDCDPEADGVRPVEIARRLGIGRASVYRILDSRRVNDSLNV